MNLPQWTNAQGTSKLGVTLSQCSSRGALASRYAAVAYLAYSIHKKSSSPRVLGSTLKPMDNF